MMLADDPEAHAPITYKQGYMPIHGNDPLARKASRKTRSSYESICSDPTNFREPSDRRSEDAEPHSQFDEPYSKEPHPHQQESHFARKPAAQRHPSRKISYAHPFGGSLSANGSAQKEIGSSGNSRFREEGRDDQPENEREMIPIRPQLHDRGYPASHHRSDSELHYSDVPNSSHSNCESQHYARMKHLPGPPSESVTERSPYSNQHAQDSRDSAFYQPNTLPAHPSAAGSPAHDHSYRDQREHKDLSEHPSTALARLRREMLRDADPSELDAPAGGSFHAGLSSAARGHCQPHQMGDYPAQASGGVYDVHRQLPEEYWQRAQTMLHPRERDHRHPAGVAYMPNFRQPEPHEREQHSVCGHCHKYQTSICVGGHTRIRCECGDRWHPLPGTQFRMLQDNRPSDWSSMEGRQAENCRQPRKDVSDLKEIIFVQETGQKPNKKRATQSSYIPRNKSGTTSRFIPADDLPADEPQTK